MKHIKEILEPRKMQIEQTQQGYFFSSQQQDKGSSEWSIFNPIAYDRVDAYRVRAPRKRHELRYPNIIPIHRYPRHLTVKFAGQ